MVNPTLAADNSGGTKRVVNEVGNTDAAAAAQCAAEGGTWNPTTKTCTKKPETPVDNRTGTVPVTSTEIVETPPKEGDYKAGADGQPLVFKDGRWEVYGARNTREIITEDPATVAAREQEEVAGADANMPADQYLQSLGTDTLAGQAYQRALALRMASIDEQQLAAGQSYGDMYEQAKMSQAARRGMSDVSGMTGGMADQAQSRMSAAEIASLGQIGMGREATMRQLEMAELNAPMEAFQEGAQMDEFERARQMQDTQMQQAETLFEQAQSGWRQDPTTGEWTNIDKQTQDALSLQAINATQRAEVLGEMQYWQAVLADPTQAMLHANAQQALGTLQTRYGELLANNSVMTGVPSGTTPETDTPETDTPETENTITTEEGEIVPRVTPEDGGVEIETGLSLTGSMNSYISNKLTGLGITETMELPNFNNQIRDAEDLAPFIQTLAGDKATEGYDFAPEFELVNRYLKNPTEVSKAEYNRLQAAGIIKNSVDYYDAAHDVQIGSGGSFAKFSTDNPANAQFVEQLINSGYIDREFAEPKNGEYNLGIILPMRKTNNYNLTWAGLYDQFLSGSLIPTSNVTNASPIDIFG
jgi:hypothetical protein